jgi:hypothetical protein
MADKCSSLLFFAALEMAAKCSGVLLRADSAAYAGMCACSYDRVRKCAAMSVSRESCIYKHDICAYRLGYRTHELRINVPELVQVARDVAEAHHSGRVGRMAGECDDHKLVVQEVVLSRKKESV